MSGTNSDNESPEPSVYLGRHRIFNNNLFLDMDDVYVSDDELANTPMSSLRRLLRMRELDLTMHNGSPRLPGVFVDLDSPLFSDYDEFVSDDDSEYSFESYADTECTEGFCSDSDSEFYVPTNTHFQSGEFDDESLGSSYSNLSDRARYIKEGVTSFLGSDLPANMPSFAELMGDKLCDLQSSSSVNMLLDTAFCTYRLVVKLKLDGSPSNLIGSLLEFYTGVTGIKVSSMCQLPNCVFECFNISSDLESQSGVFDVDVGSLLSSWRMLKNSVVVEKIKKLAAMCATLGVATSLGMNVSDTLFARIWRTIKPLMCEVDLFAQICEAIHVIYTKCMGAFTSKSFADLADGDVLKDLDSRVAVMTLLADKYITGNNTADDMDIFAANAEALDVMRLCLYYSKKCEAKAHKMQFASQYIKMGLIHTALSRKLNEKAIVPAAFCVTLFGQPGTGKSANCQILACTIQHAMGLDIGAKYVYVLQSDDKFMTNYDNQNTIIVDDLANADPMHSEVNPSNLIIGLINNNKKVATKAAVDEKGKSLIVAQSVIVTTNIKHGNAKVYSNCPDAMLRRLGKVIELKVKPEFCKPGTYMLDPNVNVAAEHYDVWNVEVSEYNPTEKGYVIVHDDVGPLKDVGMPRVVRYIAKAAAKHKENQDRLIKQIDNQEQVPFCEHGVFVNTCDLCPRPDVLSEQAGMYGGLSFMLKSSMRISVLADNIYYGNVKCMWYLYALLSLFMVLVISDYLYVGKISLFTYLLVVTIVVFSAYCYKDIMKLRSLVYKVSNFKRVAVELRDTILGSKAAIFGVTVVVLGVAAGVWKLYKRKCDLLEEQGSAVSYPQYEKNMPDDVWKKPFVEKKLVQPVNPTMTGLQLSGVLMPKMRVLLFYNERATGEYCIGIPLCTYLMLVPKHMADKKYSTMSVVRHDTNTHNAEVKVLLDGAVYPIADTDYCIVYAPCIGDELDIRKFLPKRENLRKNVLSLKHAAARTVYVKYEPASDDEGNMYRKLMRFNKGVNVSTCNFSVEGINQLEGATYVFPETTYKGLCGAPTITEGPDPLIVGFHCAGVEGTTSGRLNTLYYEDVMSTIDLMMRVETAMVQGAEQSPLDLNHVKMPFQHVLPKVSSADYNTGEVQYLGSHTGRPRTLRSAVKPSIISDSVAELTGVPREHGPPRYLGHWSAWSTWLKYASKPAIIPQRVINAAYSDLWGKISEQLEAHPEWRDLIHKIPDDVVINGMDGVKGCGSLNMNSSIGLFDCRPKSEYLVPFEGEVVGISNPRMFNKSTMDQYHHMEEVLSEGVRTNSPFRLNMKDEAIKLDKAKVRLFSGGQNALLMVIRKYFLTVSMFMQNHMELFETAVGVNCAGSDWDELKKIITRFGSDRIIAGDYEKYDQRVMNAITLASFKILINICMWAGYDQEDKIVMEAIATELCNPIYEMDGLWMQLGSTTPSGHGLTVVINGLSNCMYLRMPYNELKPEGHNDKFHECVSAMTYGDDNLMSVREDCPWYNHSSIQKWFAQYGINYTMADKSEGSVPYIHLDDASFLKRKWVYDEELGINRCPLEIKSIFKMLHTTLVSKTEPIENQVGSTISTANREFFQHGKVKFEEMRDVLLKIATKHDLVHYLPNSHLETYDELAEWCAR